MSKPIHDYSPSELTTLRTRLESAREKITDEMISAGRGYEKSSETFQKSDPLALRFQSNSRAFAELHGETKRRIEYHGSLKKIKSNPVKYRPGSKCLVSCKGHGFYAGSGKKRRSIRLTRDPSEAVRTTDERAHRLAVLLNRRAAGRYVFKVQVE